MLERLRESDCARLYTSWMWDLDVYVYSRLIYFITYGDYFHTDLRSGTKKP